MKYLKFCNFSHSHKDYVRYISHVQSAILINWRFLSIDKYFKYGTVTNKGLDEA